MPATRPPRGIVDGRLHEEFVLTSGVGLQNRLERRIDNLPVLPTVVGQLLMLDREDDRFFDRVLRLVESDPSFAARMLSAANSASSAPRVPVTSVRSALTRLGSVGASNMILAVAVTRVFIPRDAWERSLWRHALQVGGALRALTLAVHEPFGFTADDAFAAGLLHDIGRFVMFEEAPDLLRQIDEGGWNSPGELIETEREICGVSHTELGAHACERWGLPHLLADVVRRHHEPDIDPNAGPVDALIALTHFTDLAMFPSAMPGSPGYDAAGVEVIEAELMPKLPDGFIISANSLHDIISTVTAEVDDICRALGIG